MSGEVMTTIRDVANYSREDLIPFLSLNNFNKYNTLNFYRKRHGWYDLIEMRSIVSGWRLRISLSVWVPSMTPEYDERLFPKKFCNIHDRIICCNLGPVGTGFGVGSWSIKHDFLIPEAISDIEKVIKKYGLPWFDRFQDKHELHHMLNEDDENYEHFSKLVSEVH